MFRKIIQITFVGIGVLAGSQTAFAQSCQGEFFSDETDAPVINGSVTISNLFTPEFITFRTERNGPIRVEDISVDNTDSVISLFSVNVPNQTLNLIDSNDDRESLRARVDLSSAPAGVYCADIEGFAGSSIEVDIQIETSPTQNSDALPACLVSEIRRVGYFDDLLFLDSPSNSNEFVAVGTIAVETDGTLESIDVSGAGTNGDNIRFHPIDDIGLQSDLSTRRQVRGDTTYCLFASGSLFHEIQYEPTEDIFENGFVQFPPNELRLPEVGGPTSFNVSLQSAIELPIEFSVEVSSSTDASSSDFTQGNYLGSFNTFSIPVGQTSVSVAVPINNDTVQEPAETVQLSFFSGSDDTPDAVVNVIIEDDDTPSANRNPNFTTDLNMVSGTVNEPLNITINAADPDGDPLNFTLSNAPAWLSVVTNSDRSSALLSGTPTEAGSSNNITLNIDDGRGGAASTVFSAVVSSSEPTEQTTEDTPSGGSGGGGSFGLFMLIAILLTSLITNRRPSGC